MIPGEASLGAAQARTWRARVLSIFPEMFPGPLGLSLAGQALKSGLWALEVLDIRDFAGDKHRSVDDQPFGGGPGMVLRPDVIDRALRAAEAGATEAGGAKAGSGNAAPVIYLSPRGRVLSQALVRELAAGPGVVLLCGRYEGVDERVLEECGVTEVSLGDYVLSGGEAAALALLDAVVRLLPGVMGNAASATEESFERGLLEYPHYTRPAVWRNREVPEILLSGHHENIRRWRLAQAERITKARRPDLWTRYRNRQNRDEGPEQ